MSTTTADLKSLVAKHYDYAPQGTGQFFNGDWFTPKHKDSLDDLLEEITDEWQSEAEEELMEDLDKAHKKISELESKINKVDSALA